MSTVANTLLVTPPSLLFPHSLVWKGDIQNSLTTPTAPNDNILDQIELWTSHRHSLTKLSSNIENITTTGFVDPTKLPLWLVSGGVLRVLSNSKVSKNFFQTLANCSSTFPTNDATPTPVIANLGLLTEISLQESNSKQRQPFRQLPQYLLFFIEWIPIGNESSSTYKYKPIICAAPLSIDTRYSPSHLSKIKIEPYSSPRFISNKPSSSPPSSSKPLTKSRSVTSSFNPLDKITNPRNTTPFQKAVALKSTHNDSIYKPTTSTGETPQERRIKSLVQRIVLAELRLRGITKDNNHEFNQLYSQTYKSACFSVRKRFTSSTEEFNEIAEIQDKVDQLLTIFIDY